jgi:phosphate transport system substrate-binding protein
MMETTFRSARFPAAFSTARFLILLLVSAAGLSPAGAPTAHAETVAAPPAAIDPALPGYVATTRVSGVIGGVTGMDSVEGMMKAWSEAFAKHHPGVVINLVMRDVAPEERIALGPNTEEVFHADDSAYENRYGYAPFRIRICQGAFILKSHVSAIGVFVNHDNPLDEIPLDKLDAIYSDARRRGYPADITTWGQLGLSGEWADKPIHIYGFYGRDDVTWYFRDLVSYDAPFKAGYRVPGEDLSRRTPVVAGDLMATLSKDPYAIGFANFSYRTGPVKALGLVDERGVISQPVFGDMVSGRYPLQRGIYIYVNRKPGTPLSPLMKEFLNFVLSKDGQGLVQVDHYLPLTAAMAAADRAKLD